MSDLVPIDADLWGSTRAGCGFRFELLKRVDFNSAWPLKRLLAFPEGTAGSIMSTEFVSVPATYTVAETLRHIREVERTRETVYAIQVLDPKSRALQRVVT